MGTLTTLLFDVDGTLAETEEIHRESFNRAFAQAGLDWVWSKALYAELVAGDWWQGTYTLLSRHASAGLRSTHEVGRVYRRPARGQDGYLYPHRGGRRSAAADRVSSACWTKHARAGLRLAIATTTTPANVTALLRHSLAPDAESWFEVIAAGGVVPAKKPAPDIYHYVMEKMGVSPAECLAFEDSANGLRSARAAGVTTLVTVSEYSRVTQLRGGGAGTGSARRT